MASFFASLQAQAESFGNTLTSELDRVSSQVSTAVREAQSNLDQEAAALSASKAEEQAKGGSGLLPWEMRDKDAVTSVPGLMERVLSLSLDASTFETAVPDAFGANFDLMEHIAVIEQLLELDPNLSAMQARHSATMDEDHFWSAYFYQCEQLKIECLADAEYEKVANPTGIRVPDQGLEAEATPEDDDSDADVDDEELEAAIEAELMAEESQGAQERAQASAGDEADLPSEGAQADGRVDAGDDDELEMSSGEIIDAEDELDDDELEAQIAAELGFEEE